MTTIQIDDLDPSITYSGAWQEIEGSTRQWGGGTVHSTTQQGASASITFSGTRIKMYCTLLHGLGNEIAIIHFNGQTSTVSMPSQPTDVYNGVWFDSGVVPTGRYTLVVSNGGNSDTPLQLDRFSVTGLVVTPTAPQPPPQPSPQPPSPSSPVVTDAPQALEPNSPTTTQVTLVPVAPDGDSSDGAGQLLVSTLSLTNSGASSTGIAVRPSGLLASGTATALGQTAIVSIQSIQDVSTMSIMDGNSPTQIANSSSPTSLNAASTKTPIGAIIGGVIGGLLFLAILLLVFFVFGRRRKARQHVLLPDETEGVDNRTRSLTTVTPFRLDSHAASTHSLISSHLDAHETNSAASSFFAGGYPGSVPYGSRHRSIEKVPFSHSDTRHYPSSPLTHGTAITTMSTSDSPRDHFPRMHHDAREHAAASGLHTSHHQAGDGISSSASSSFYMPIHDANDILRPPSYHLIQSLGN